MEKNGETFQPTTLVDLGCGVGVSTSFLAGQFPSARAVYGIDLSPFYLDYAVRKSPKIVYIHRDMTETRLCSNSVDLVQPANIERLMSVMGSPIAEPSLSIRGA